MRNLNIIYLEDYRHLTRGLIIDHENIILHYVSDPRSKTPFDVQTVLNVFEEYQVSTHYIIPRDGTILEMIEPTKKAWHAGKSQYNGTTGLNKNSIGIELVGNDEEEFTDAQYESLHKLCAELHFKYDIPTKNIKGHQIVSDITVRPDPKPDPGRMFDWVRFGFDLTKYILLQEQQTTNAEEHY